MSQCVLKDGHDGDHHSNQGLNPKKKGRCPAVLQWSEDPVLPASRLRLTDEQAELVIKALNFVFQYFPDQPRLQALHKQLSGKG